jgi:hypothetical protein
MRYLKMTVIAAALAATTAQSAPLTGDVAKTMLFAVGDAQVQIVSGSPVTPDEAKLLATVVTDQPYFGAIAISPDEKLLESKATIAVANFHSTEAAGNEARRQCDALRIGKSPCVVVAVIRPKGWDKRPLSLSSEATEGFRKSYPATKGALAISASTGSWGIASGNGAADAAVKACAAKLADKDCSVVVTD